MFMLRPRRAVVARRLAAYLIAAVAIVVVMLAQSPRASADETIQISDWSFKNYQKYLKTIGSTKKGAFAVSDDGGNSYFTYCYEANCLDNSLARDAIKGCESLTGLKCLILAYGREERMKFTVVAGRSQEPVDDEILANVLSAERLKAYMVGNTMRGEYLNHKKWIEYYGPDGTLRGHADSLGSFRGHYEFKDTTICYYYDGHSDWNWCTQLSVFADHIYFLENGKLVTNEFNTELLQGNPENL
jgi:hypothetical protein